jgi:hypothetical protein
MLNAEQLAALRPFGFDLRLPLVAGRRGDHRRLDHRRPRL